MQAGLSRGQAVRQLTREIPLNASDPNFGFADPANIPLDGHVFDLGLSSDGQRIAFATARQRFPLAPPNLLGAPPAQVGLTELYLMNLEGETLQRVTHGAASTEEASLIPNLNLSITREGEGVASPSFGLGGRLIAFSSVASNLVPGDGNDASDAFVVEDNEAPGGAGASSISPGPRPRRIRGKKGMTLSASSLPSGSVRLQAVVPSAGALRARAHGALTAGGKVRSLAAARDRIRQRGGGTVRVILRLSGRLRRLAHTQEGVYAMARVNFHRRHGRVLRGRIQVRFHVHSRHRGHG